ncbi:hypothetical protein EAF00_001276 [Botryotinia globosa]|nr:hypothetical protein EAF00_001276 [Botryotinia globosa]
MIPPSHIVALKHDTPSVLHGALYNHIWRSDSESDSESEENQEEREEKRMLRARRKQKAEIARQAKIRADEKKRKDKNKSRSIEVGSTAVIRRENDGGQARREERPKINIPKEVPGPKRVSDRQMESGPRRKLESQRATGSTTVPSHRAVHDPKTPDPKKASGPKRSSRNERC